MHHRRRVAEALLGLAAGAAMIAAGIVVPLIGLAVAGFVVLLLCGIWALNSWRQMATVALGAAGPAASGTTVKSRSRRKRGNRVRRDRGAPRGTLGERIDERWRRRQEGDI